VHQHQRPLRQRGRRRQGHPVSAASSSAKNFDTLTCTRSGRDRHRHPEPTGLEHTPNPEEGYDDPAPVTALERLPDLLSPAMRAARLVEGDVAVLATSPHFLAIGTVAAQ
jgi:hypothetical protein